MLYIIMVNRELNKPKILEGETIETHWDPKKLTIGVVILLVLGLLGAIMLSGIGNRSSGNDREALGITNEEKSPDNQDTPSLPTRTNVERIISETRKTLSNITAENLTSSQAAIQKMIQDLEKLREGKSTTDIFCDLVCKK